MNSPPVSAVSTTTPIDRSDVILIGSGIMSANLGVMLKCLEPRLRIQLFEVTGGLAQESSDGWNNAGTGHAGICEVSYTPKREADGSVNVSRAIAIFEQFEHSKQFWSHAVASGMVGDPADFIHAVPHIGFVHGRENVEFLQARHAAMVQHHFFKPMEYTADRKSIDAWAPLVMENRDEEPVAATKMDSGTEVNFGVLARKLLAWLGQQDGCGVATGHRVTGLLRTGGEWEVSATHLPSGEHRVHRANFVFVGAGGGSLRLLQTTGLPEVRGLAGFPIGGQWLVCDTPETVSRHCAKVYGMVPGSAPGLGGPHLDARRLDGKSHLLFGPFASWTTKFLHKTGRRTDLPFSIRPGNLTTLLKTGLRSRHLVGYLLAQGMQSMADRMEALREFYPAARDEEWRLIDAGIRVQTLKKPDRGAVYFGTEVFTGADDTLAALLGASPGASVSVSIVLEVIRKCLPHLLATSTGQARMKEMIPSCDEDLKLPSNCRLFQRINTAAEEILRLRPICNPR